MSQNDCEAALSEARQERDEFRERLKSMREANASLVEQRAVSTLRQVAQLKAKVDEQAAAIAEAQEEWHITDQHLAIERERTLALQQHVLQQAATIRQLQESLQQYGIHDIDCSNFIMKDRPCSCGLHVAMGRSIHDKR